MSTNLEIGSIFRHVSSFGEITDYEVIRLVEEYDGTYGNVDVIEIVRGSSDIVGRRYSNRRVTRDAYFESNGRLWISISPQEKACLEISH